MNTTQQQPRTMLVNPALLWPGYTPPPEPVKVESTKKAKPAKKPAKKKVAKTPKRQPRLGIRYGEKEGSPHWTRENIARQMALELGVSAAKVDDALFNALETAKEKLMSGMQLRIAGLGVFQVRDHAGGKGRNIATGGCVNVPAFKLLAFRSSEVFKCALNGGTAS